MLPSWFQAYVGLEESAESIRSYDTQFVPGLLQTEAVRDRVLALGEFSPEETERLVFLRKERQKRFASGQPAADRDHRRNGPAPHGRRPGVMRGQFEHLLEPVDRPGFTLQVTPFPVGANVAPASFSILQFATPDLPDVVYVEQLTSALYLDKAPEVARYTAAMDRLSRAERHAQRVRQDRPVHARATWRGHDEHVPQRHAGCRPGRPDLAEEPAQRADRGELRGGRVPAQR